MGGNLASYKQGIKLPTVETRPEWGVCLCGRLAGEPQATRGRACLGASRQDSTHTGSE